jgi:hypothetical protein
MVCALQHGKLQAGQAARVSRPRWASSPLLLEPPDDVSSTWLAAVRARCGAGDDGRMFAGLFGGFSSSDKMIRRVSLNRRQGGSTRAPSLASYFPRKNRDGEQR